MVYSDYMNKNKLLPPMVNIGLLVLPWIVGQLVVDAHDGDAAQAAGLAIGLMLLVVTPINLAIGLLVTFLTRRSRRAIAYSLLGFGIPSALTSMVCLALLIN